MLRELVSLCPPAILSWNPIQVYEAMTDRDDVAYCPFAFGYSNYAHPHPRWAAPGSPPRQAAASGKRRCSTRVTSHPKHAKEPSTSKAAASRDTLATLDRAYLRPRHCGYIDFQPRAGAPLHRFLREGGDARAVVQEPRL